MEQPLITSPGHPLAKEVRSLRQRKARARTGLFIAEGIRPIGEAFSAGWKVKTILFAPDQLNSGFAKNVIARAAREGIESRPVSARVMKSIADKENPQGIIAIIHQRHSNWDDLRKFRLGAAVISPQDPGNVGTILRTLDAVGGDYLLMVDGGVDPYHPTSLRASMGTLFWVPIVETQFTEMLDWSRKNRIQLIGSSAHAENDYRTFLPRKPWMLVLGSEQKGLSVEQMNACDVTVRLPMRGRASSLNLAVAAGVLLYQLAAD